MAVTPLRRYGRPGMVLPQVTASFAARLTAFTIKDGKAKVTLEFGGEDEELPDGIASALQRAERDGRQQVVLVSLSRAQQVPGTETDEYMDVAEKVAVGWTLREELARALAEQRDPDTGRIEQDDERDEPAVMPVGTFVGPDPEAAVETATAVDPQQAARAAGTVAARRRRA